MRPALAILAAALLVGGSPLMGCTTFITPVACVGGPYACNGRTDVKFCEREAIAVRGGDCPDLRLTPGGKFCVVVSHASVCASTVYRVKDLDCRIVSYRAIQDAPECPVGCPTFHP